MDGRVSPLLRLRLALGDLAAEPLRTAMAVLVLTPIAASWFLLASIAGSLQTLGDFGEERNIVVTEPDVFDVANISLDAADLAAAQAAVGEQAESVTPLVLRLIELDDRVLQLRAAETDTWSQVYGLAVLEGRLPSDDAAEMAITRSVQVATGWEVGDVQRVFGTELTITALLEGSGSKVASLWMPLARAEALFERPGEFQFVVVRLSADADGNEVRAALKDVFPGHLVLDESAIQAETVEGVRSLGDLAEVFIVVGVIGLAVGSANATALTLAERGRSVALLRVMGFAPSTVRGLLATRSLLTTAAALAVGLAVCAPFIATRPSFVLRSFIIETTLSTTTVVVGCALSLGSAWLGAVVASRRVLRQPVGPLLEAR